jgi:hypothetical protein
MANWLQRGRSTRPPFKRLRVFAFDPSLNTRLETALINQVTLRIPWEYPLESGPVGEYLEVVDVDPASGACYAPVNLDDPHLLAQDGLPPSEGDPQFHQQMVYAVAMTTIQNFEEALGRRTLWSPRIYKDDHGRIQHEFIPRLRVYPHALREANAYYSPEKKALLFGYFPASRTNPGDNLPGGMVFTCLSHDIVAHELTHALLDGMHRRFIEPSNVDVLALHEAFSDIVALFQHFSFPEVLRHQIARTRGDLASQNLLAQLAQQFGQAIGRYGALRDALGYVDKETGEWKPAEPDPREIERTTEPHSRGALLVAAVFDAFLAIYRFRIADLLRIATGGSGILPAGELHPDLVSRLADEAAKTARHILRMCIRALDYCPPVDVTYGDYLRALITADADLMPDDRLNYRVALVEAFRRRGIYPIDVRSLSEESLRWQPPSQPDQEEFRRAFRSEVDLRSLCPDWGLTSDRHEIYKQTRQNQRTLQQWLSDPPLPDAVKAVGLTLDPDAPRSIYRSKGRPALEVHSVRPAHRIGPGGQAITDLVVEMTQRRRGYCDPEVQRKVDAGQLEQRPDFIFRGGCTLLIDLETGRVRYSIGKGIQSQRRLDAQRRFFSQPTNPSLQFTYFGDPRDQYFTDIAGGGPVEPFALLHRASEEEVP